jgi:hypothetical protein
MHWRRRLRPLRDALLNVVMEAPGGTQLVRLIDLADARQREAELQIHLDAATAKIAVLEAELRPLAHPTPNEQKVEDEDRQRRELSARIAAGDDGAF